MLATRAVHAKRRKVKESYGKRHTTVMERLLLDVLVMTGKQASTKRNSAVMCSVVPAEAGRDLFKRDEGEPLVAGAHVHRIEELRYSCMQLCVYTVIYFDGLKKLAIVTQSPVRPQ